MNYITPTPSRINHCNKSYYQITRRLAGAAVWVGLAFSPVAVLAADIVGTSGTPLIINTDQSGDNAYGVKTLTVNAENGVVDIQPGGIINIAWGGYSNDGSADSNQVIISGGKVNVAVNGGTSVNSNAESNQVTVYGGMLNGEVSGGASGNGDANNNQVTINGGTLNSYVEGGYSFNGNADNNQIAINGGTVNGNVWGGISGSNANNNQVTITGGTFTDIIAAVGGSGTVKDNNLTIIGGNFANSVDLYGYYTGGTPPATASGNSIHLKVAGLTINNIVNVNNLYFYLPASIQNGDSVAILQDAAGTDLSSTIIGVCSTVFGTLAVGDEITLIDAAGTLQTSSDTPANDTGGMTGCSPVYQFELKKVNNTLIAKVKGATAPRQGAQPIPGLGGKTLALLMLILAAITAWFIHRRSAMAL